MTKQSLYFISTQIFLLLSLKATLHDIIQNSKKFEDLSLYAQDIDEAAKDIGYSFFSYYGKRNNDHVFNVVPLNPLHETDALLPSLTLAIRFDNLRADQKVFVDYQSLQSCSSIANMLQLTELRYKLLIPKAITGVQFSQKDIYRFYKRTTYACLVVQSQTLQDFSVPLYNPKGSISLDFNDMAKEFIFTFLNEIADMQIALNERGYLTGGLVPQNIFLYSDSNEWKFTPWKSLHARIGELYSLSTFKKNKKERDIMSDIIHEEGEPEDRLLVEIKILMHERDSFYLALYKILFQNFSILKLEEANSNNMFVLYQEYIKQLDGGEELYIRIRDHFENLITRYTKKIRI